MIFVLSSLFRAFVINQAYSYSDFATMTLLNDAA
jgi:hypothetical protein